jgi:hypothetical protein
MNKIKLLIILPLLTLFFLSAKLSFAQAQVPQNIIQNPLFDMRKVVTTGLINLSNTTPQDITIMPFSKITIQPKSFNDNVNAYVFKGNWDKITPLLPNGQSEISSYYLVFVDSKGKQATPTKAFTIQSYNNYVGTDTFFYPVTSAGSVDSANSQKWPGHIIVNTALPIQDSGFIVSVNKLLDKSDPSLDPLSHPPVAQNKAGLNNPDVQKYLTLTVLLVVALLLSYILWGNKKNRRKRS